MKIDREMLAEVLHDMQQDRRVRNRCVSLPELLRTELCIGMMEGEEYRDLHAWLKTKVVNPPGRSSIQRFHAELTLRMRIGRDEAESRLARIAKSLQDCGVMAVLRVGRVEIELRPI